MKYIEVTTTSSTITTTTIATEVTWFLNANGGDCDFYFSEEDCIYLLTLNNDNRQDRTEYYIVNCGVHGWVNKWIVSIPLGIYYRISVFYS
jgi:hypothetical protein